MAAIAIHHTGTDTGAWDGPAAEGKLKSGQDAAYYRRAFAWQDPEGDPTTKAAYRFIHHEVTDSGQPVAANTRACSSAIAVLNGGRGGTTIPDADRKGVWSHLAAHLKDAGMTPPDLREGDREGEAAPRPYDDRGGIEERSIPAIELRAEEVAGAAPHIAGYAALFNVLSENLGSFREKIAPGAFASSLATDVRALWNHDRNYVLGRTTSGSLKLAEDGQGLAFDVTPPDTQWARDVLVSIRRGDVSEMSFAFLAKRDEWATDANSGELVRTLLDVQLFDVSPVTYPAYPQTSAQVRSRVAELQHGSGTGVLLPAEAGAAARARLASLRRRLEMMELE